MTDYVPDETPVKNIPEGVKPADLFQHVSPEEVATNPAARQEVVEYYRKLRQKWLEVEAAKAAKKVTGKGKKFSELKE